MDTVEIFCRVHSTDVRLHWRNGKPDDSYVPCPLCVAEDNRKLRDELNQVRDHRNALLQCIDLKRTIAVKDNPDAAR